ncbi:MAG: YceI family protein [Collimonas sp.]|uniref:YceI family protein n=1 Tax=Collimonas sp. TaxID=1963772 RepID=UPI0032676599
MKPSLFNITLATLIAVGSSASSTQAQSVKLESVKPGTYKVDGYHTQVVFSVSHLGFTNYTGIFAGPSGSLRLDPAKLSESKLDISIPVDSVTTTANKLTTELKGDQWFDVAKFPVATFVSTKIVPTGDGTVDITGNFTLHGVTKPVVLNAHFVGSGVNPMTKAYTVGFEATAAIKRGDFGVKTYLPLVGDEIKLNIAGAFEMRE